MGQIKIIKPGLLTTVQDLGRFGYQQFGMPVAGAMDHVSARLANLLVGNDEGEGLLEATMIGPEIEFLEPMVIGITGGDLLPEINQQPIPMYRSILVQKGDILGFKGVKEGCRSYIAFAGGIDVPLIMGSKSTYTRGKVGGYEGRSLKSGDILNIGQPTRPMEELVGREIRDRLYEYGSKVEVRVLMGPQDDAFTEKGIETFLQSEYIIANESDRMGYSLKGNTIEHKEGGDIISDGISMGAVQVPSHGHPIIMMADRQTTGGYTKIGNVIYADLPKVAQAKPGDTITFKRVQLEEAHWLIEELEGKIAAIKENLNAQQSVEYAKTRKFNLRINGKIYQVSVTEMKEPL